MEQCLFDNNVCSNRNMRCDECSLDDCKKILLMCEKKNKIEENKKLKLLNKMLPASCVGCSLLEIINLNEYRVFCPYMIKNKCIVKQNT